MLNRIKLSSLLFAILFMHSSSIYSPEEASSPLQTLTSAVSDAASTLASRVRVAVLRRIPGTAHYNIDQQIKRDSTQVQQEDIDKLPAKDREYFNNVLRQKLPRIVQPAAVSQSAEPRATAMPQAAADALAAQQTALLAQRATDTAQEPARAVGFLAKPAAAAAADALVAKQTALQAQRATDTAQEPARAAGFLAKPAAAAAAEAVDNPELRKKTIQSMTPQQLIQALEHRTFTLHTTDIKYLTEAQLQPHYIDQYKLFGNALKELATRVTSIEQAKALLQKNKKTSSLQVILLKNLPRQILQKIDLSNINAQILQKMVENANYQDLLNRFDDSQQSKIKAKIIPLLSHDSLVQLIQRDQNNLRYATDTQITEFFNAMPEESLSTFVQKTDLSILITLVKKLDGPNIIKLFKELRRAETPDQYSQISSILLTDITPQTALQIAQQSSDPEFSELFTDKQQTEISAQAAPEKQKQEIEALLPRLSPDEIIGLMKAGKLSSSNLKVLTPAQLSPANLALYPFSLSDISEIAPMLTTTEQVVTMLNRQYSPDFVTSSGDIVKINPTMFPMTLLRNIRPEVRATLPAAEIPADLLFHISQDYSFFNTLSKNQQEIITQRLEKYAKSLTAAPKPAAATARTSDAQAAIDILNDSTASSPASMLTQLSAAQIRQALKSPTPTMYQNLQYLTGEQIASFAGDTNISLSKIALRSIAPKLNIADAIALLNKNHAAHINPAGSLTTQYADNPEQYNTECNRIILSKLSDPVLEELPIDQINIAVLKTLPKNILFRFTPEQQAEIAQKIAAEKSAVTPEEEE